MRYLANKANIEQPHGEYLIVWEGYFDLASNTRFCTFTIKEA